MDYVRRYRRCQCCSCTKNDRILSFPGNRWFPVGFLRVFFRQAPLPIDIRGAFRGLLWATYRGQSPAADEQQTRKNRRGIAVTRSRKRRRATSRPIEDALRRIISECGDPAIKIAEESGVPQPSITRFLRRERKLSMESADKLADYFGLELVPRIDS